MVHFPICSTIRVKLINILITPPVFIAGFVDRSDLSSHGQAPDRRKNLNIKCSLFFEFKCGPEGIIFGLFLFKRKSET